MLIPVDLVAKAMRNTSALVPPVVLAIDANGPKCETLGQCRTIGNITWSCLATIFACIWVSIHPNIPRPQPTFKGLGKSPSISAQLADFWGRRVRNPCTSLLEKLAIALLALLAPEFIFVWALRQRVRASSLVEECQGAAREARAVREAMARLRVTEADKMQQVQESPAATRNRHTAADQHRGHQSLSASDASSHSEDLELELSIDANHVDRNTPSLRSATGCEDGGVSCRGSRRIGRIGRRGRRCCSPRRLRVLGLGMGACTCVMLLAIPFVFFPHF